MKRFCGAAALIAALAITNSASAAETLIVQHQGIDREYLEHRPTAAKTELLPLVIYLHGVRPSNWKNHTLAELDELADRESFIAIYPKAVHEHWNYVSVEGPRLAKAGAEVADDVAFIEKLIDRYVSTHGADPKRVFVLGDSRGGLMTYTLMCQLSHKISAAGPMITGMTDVQLELCKPSHPVPLMVVAGTNDTFQPYEGWLYPKSGFRLASIPETMEFWRLKHKCTGQQSTPVPHREPQDKTRVTKIEWSDCDRSGAVVLYRVAGGGPQIPSIAHPANAEWLQEGGPQNHDVEAVAEFWAFAKNFLR